MLVSHARVTILSTRDNKLIFGREKANQGSLPRITIYSVHQSLVSWIAWVKQSNNSTFKSCLYITKFPSPVKWYDCVSKFIKGCFPSKMIDPWIEGWQFDNNMQHPWAVLSCNQATYVNRLQAPKVEKSLQGIKIRKRYNHFEMDAKKKTTMSMCQRKVRWPRALSIQHKFWFEISENSRAQWNGTFPASSSGASFFAWQRRARNEWQVMNRKGPWEGYRQQVHACQILCRFLGTAQFLVFLSLGSDQF